MEKIISGSGIACAKALGGTGDAQVAEQKGKEKRMEMGR